MRIFKNVSNETLNVVKKINGKQKDFFVKPGNTFAYGDFDDRFMAELRMAKKIELVEAKFDFVDAMKGEIKPKAKPAPKPEAKPEAKPEPEVKPETKPEVKVAPKGKKGSRKKSE